MAVQSKHYVVKNGNGPTPANITEEKESELEEFIDNDKFFMGTLGHKVFIPLVVTTPAPAITEDTTAVADTSDELLYSYHSGVKATGKRTSEGFVVLKGSQISAKLTKSCPDPTLHNREKCAAKADENFVLTEDILFTSPSAVASYIDGASLSGNAT